MKIQNFLINEFEKNEFSGNILKSPYTEDTYYITAGTDKDIITGVEINTVIKVCKKYKYIYYFDTQKGYMVIHEDK